MNYVYHCKHCGKSFEAETKRVALRKIANHAARELVHD